MSHPSLELEGGFMARGVCTVQTVCLDQPARGTVSINSGPAPQPAPPALDAFTDVVEGSPKLELTH